MIFRRLTIILFVIVLVYLLVWNLSQSYLSDSLKEIFAKDFPAITYEEMKYGGFPFRYDFILTKPKLVLRDSEMPFKTEFSSEDSLVLSSNIIGDHFRVVLPKELLILSEGSDKKSLIEFGTNNSYELKFAKSLIFMKKEQVAEDFVKLVTKLSYEQPSELKSYEIIGDKKEQISSVEKLSFSITKKDKNSQGYNIKLHILNYKVASIGDEINGLPEALRTYVKDIAQKNNETNIDGDINVSDNVKYRLNNANFKSDYLTYTASGEVNKDFASITFNISKYEILNKIISNLFNIDESVVDAKIKEFASEIKQADDVSKTPLIVYNIVSNGSTYPDFKVGKLSGQKIVSALLGIGAGNANNKKIDNATNPSNSTK